MAIDTSKISFIPGNMISNLNDGECISYNSNSNSEIHIDLAMRFLKEYNLDSNNTDISIEKIGEYLSSIGIISFINLGIISGKRAAIIYLPSNMTNKQIEFLESQKDMLSNSFYEDDTFFRTFVYPDREMDYKTTSGLRDLNLENKIYNKNMNGQEIFYDEIKTQKENIVTY